MQLGMALKLMGDAPRSQQALGLALKTPRNDSKNWMADYGSQLRDNALMLSCWKSTNCCRKHKTLCSIPYQKKR